MQTMTDEEKLQFIEEVYQRFMDASENIKKEYWDSIRKILKDIDEEKIKNIRKKLRTL